MKKILEGKAQIFVPESLPISRKAEVFYNPKMSINRSFSILFLLPYAQKITFLRIFDMLASSGVRGIRYYLELPGQKEVFFCDKNPKAIELLKKNVEINGIKEAHIYNEDVRKLCLELQDSEVRFNLLDLDPFGSPLHFVYFAGLVADRKLSVHAITATDLGALYAQSIKATIKKYGAYNSKTSEIREEVALRILLGFIAKELLKNDLGIKVLGYHAYKHFIRVYLAVSANYYDSTIESLGLLVYSRSSFSYLRLMDFGESRELRGLLFGPLWIGSLADLSYLAELEQAILSQHQELEYLGSHLTHAVKYLELLKEEAKAFKDSPSTVAYPYNFLGKLARIASLPKISELVEKLREEGFTASRSPLYGMNAIRTSAPLEEILEILKKLK